VQVEAARRTRTDARFREQIERHLEETEGRRESRLERLRGLARDDVPIEVIAHFLGTLANGFAFSRVTDDPMPDLDQLMTLVETGVAPR
jgi:TetR/AcrR family transcriptional regulator, transcriptional repressor of aconitase